MRAAHVIDESHYALELHDAEYEVIVLALKFLESAYTLSPQKAAIAKGIRLQLEGCKR